MTNKSIVGATALFLLACGCGDNSDGPNPRPPVDDPMAQDGADELASLLDNNDTRLVSCGSITMAMSNSDDTLAMVIHSPILGALEDTPPQVGEMFAIDLAEMPQALRVKTGTNLTREECNDAIEPNRLPVVEAEFLPIAGIIRIEVIEHLSAFPIYNASVSLEGVRFADEGAEISRDLGSVTFGDMPG